MPRAMIRAMNSRNPIRGFLNIARGKRGGLRRADFRGMLRLYCAVRSEAMITADCRSFAPAIRCRGMPANRTRRLGFNDHNFGDASRYIQFDIPLLKIALACFGVRRGRIQFRFDLGADDFSREPAGIGGALRAHNCRFDGAHSRHRIRLRFERAFEECNQSAPQSTRINGRSSETR